jgi:TRAP-type transport system small permease protein
LAQSESRVGAGGERAWERRLDAVLGIASAVILMLMMLLTVADVFARYLLDRPMRGAFEITELMLLVLIFSGLPLVSRADEHVTMDFIDRVLGSRGRRFVVRAVHVAAAGAMATMAWLVWLKAGKIAEYGDTTDVLKVVLAPFVYFMAGMLALTAAIHVYKIAVPGEARASQATS